MKASERRLIVIFGVLATICCGAILFQRLLLMQRGIERREQTLELRMRETEALLAEEDLWKMRHQWLEDTQPAMTSENQASEELLGALLDSAARHSLQVRKKELHAAVLKNSHREVAVTLTVSGPLPSVFRWMHSVLSPESFCAIPELKVTPDSSDPSKVSAAIRFCRFHAVLTADALPQPGGKS